MIITLSPAKIMTFTSRILEMEFTEPVFKKEKDEIIVLLKEFSLVELRSLMGINRQQSESVFAQIHQFGNRNAPVSASALAYNGIAFKGLDFASLPKEEMQFAQEHLRIMSAVYGFLRPLDKINPYRLEMQAKLKDAEGRGLYEYWKERMTKYLSEQLNQDDGIWLNLASDEYSKAINLKSLSGNIQMVTPQFKEETANGYRQVVVHTKKARGLMTRFVIQNRISTVDDLKAFDSEGYCFAEHLSSSDSPVFIR